MFGFLRRLFKVSPPAAPLPPIDQTLFSAMAGYLEGCLAPLGRFALEQRLTLVIRHLIDEGVERQAAVEIALREVGGGAVQVPLDGKAVPVFLAEFVTALLDATDGDPAARPALLEALLQRVFRSQRSDWEGPLKGLTLFEASVFPDGWQAPPRPDEMIDEMLLPIVAGNLAAKDLLARPWQAGVEILPDQAVATRVLAALVERGQEEDLPETPALADLALLCRRNPALWRLPIDQASRCGAPNATPQQIENAALAWLEALRGDCLAQRLLAVPPAEAAAGSDLTRLTPPLGVALVDFVLRLQHQVRPAFKAAARPVLRSLAARLSGAPAEAVVERWIQLWKDLMLAYDGPRRASLADERIFELLAYGQTRGRKIGDGYRDALYGGRLADCEPASRDIEMAAVLWRLAATAPWTAEECLDWPLGDPAARLAAAQGQARRLLVAAGLPDSGLAAWDAGAPGIERLRAVFGYALALLRHAEYVPLELLPLFAAQQDCDLATALQRASSSWALAQGEGELLLTFLLRYAAPEQGTTAEETAALQRLLVDAANLPLRSARRLEPRAAWLGQRDEALQDLLDRPLPALPPPPLLGSEILKFWEGDNRQPMIAALAAALAADFAARRAAGEAFPRPAPETQRLVETILVFDPKRAAAYFERMM